MTSTSSLKKRLRHNLVQTYETDKLTGGWSNVYIVNGGFTECHPDFLTTPLTSSPVGMNLCTRKPKNEEISPRKLQGECVKEGDVIKCKTQTHDLYSHQPILSSEKQEEIRLRGTDMRDLISRGYFNDRKSHEYDSVWHGPKKGLWGY